MRLLYGRLFELLIRTTKLIQAGEAASPGDSGDQYRRVFGDVIVDVNLPEANAGRHDLAEILYFWPTEVNGIAVPPLAKGVSLRDVEKALGGESRNNALCLLALGDALGAWTVSVDNGIVMASAYQAEKLREIPR